MYYTTPTYYTRTDYIKVYYVGLHNIVLLIRKITFHSLQMQYVYYDI